MPELFLGACQLQPGKHHRGLKFGRLLGILPAFLFATQALGAIAQKKVRNKRVRFEFRGTLKMRQRRGKVALRTFGQSQAKTRVGRARLNANSSMKSGSRFAILAQATS